MKTHIDKPKARRIDPWLIVSLGFVLVVGAGAALAPWISPYAVGGLE